MNTRWKKSTPTSITERSCYDLYDNGTRVAYIRYLRDTDRVYWCARIHEKAHNSLWSHMTYADIADAKRDAVTWLTAQKPS